MLVSFLKLIISFTKRNDAKIITTALMIFLFVSRIFWFYIDASLFLGSANLLYLFVIVIDAITLRVAKLIKSMNKALSLYNYFNRCLSKVDTIKINAPSDVKNLSSENLVTLCAELRDYIISVVSEKGGLGARFSIVELTVALHYVFNTPYDQFSVGCWPSSLWS